MDTSRKLVVSICSGKFTVDDIEPFVDDANLCRIWLLQADKQTRELRQEGMNLPLVWSTRGHTDHSARITAENMAYHRRSYIREYDLVAHQGCPNLVIVAGGRDIISANSSGIPRVSRIFDGLRGRGGESKPCDVGFVARRVRNVPPHPNRHLTPGIFSSN